MFSIVPLTTQVCYNYSGSPFHPNIVDTSKVVMVGGWQSLLDAHDKMSLTVNEVKRIEFNTSAAGAGQSLGARHTRSAFSF